jgi:hypothetical protein
MNTYKRFEQNDVYAHKFQDLDHKVCVGVLVNNQSKSIEKSH